MFFGVAHSSPLGQVGEAVQAVKEEGRQRQCVG